VTLDVDALNALGRRVRVVLKHAKGPLTVEQIATQLKAPRSDVHDALSVSLHGWVQMSANKSHGAQ
jgi:predicted transcriptional regulator